MEDTITYAIAAITAGALLTTAVIVVGKHEEEQREKEEKKRIENVIDFVIALDKAMEIRKRNETVSHTN